MRKPPPDDARRLAAAVVDLDAAAIDRLYGLELAREAGAVPGGGPLKAVTVGCPWCGEDFDTLVDCSAGPARYIEDCQVCCQPIELASELDEAGSLVALRVARSD